MILVGSQRGGARQLAAHLLNDRDNDHVTLLGLRGFVGTRLEEALDEAHAIARGTRAKQFLFSLSFNPPKDAGAGIADLIAAADRAEAALGLGGQPRALVLHEKKGRMHLHAVWSRIDATALRAIPLHFFKNKLNALSRDLYLEHGWEVPEGHRTNGWKNPLNFSLAEWQQAQRLGLDPREIKQQFRQAWAQSDSLAALRAALEEKGYYLARGDRRAMVAVDVQGEVYALARWAGVRTRDLAQRPGDPALLPSVEEARARMRSQAAQRIRALIAQDRADRAAKLQPQIDAHRELVRVQRRERAMLAQRQEDRWTQEAKDRAARLRHGIKWVVDILTGRARSIRRANETEAFDAHKRDRAQREALMRAQAIERTPLTDRIAATQARDRAERIALVGKIAALWRMLGPAAPDHSAKRRRERGIEPEFGP